MNKELICLQCGAFLDENTNCPKCGAPITLETYGYAIKPAKRGGGFLLYNGETPVSSVRDSIKWREEVSQKHKLPINLVTEAYLKAKDGDFIDYNEKEEGPNPGAVLVVLAQTNSEAIFKDQLDETYITYREKMGVMGVMGMNTPIVKPSIPDTIDNNNVSTKHSYNRENDSHDSQTPKKTILHTVRIKSRECKQWMARLYYRDQGNTPGSDAINSAILVLEAQATEKRLMYNRVAPDGEGGIWWDMTDDLGRAIHVTKNGWSIVTEPPQIFKKYPHQLPLPEPAEVGTLKPLIEYAKSTTPNHQLLRVVTPLTYLIPEVPHVIELLGGPKGVTKSSSHRFIKSVIDPSATPLLMLPHRENLDQMVQHGDHHYFLIYDNVTKIEEDQSDLLCRMVTGLGFAKRMLYTDDDTVIRQYQRCVALNGINIPVDKPDLLDRAVLYVADQLNDKDRKTEAYIKKKMQDDAPKVLRGILDTLVKAMNLYDEVTPTKNNRMADYTRWGCAVCQALGIDYKYFERAYEENIRDQNEEAVKSSPVAEWLVKWYDYNGFKHGYTGSASELLDALLEFGSEQYNRDLKYVEGFPDGSRAFGRKLTEVIPSLDEIGYKVSYKKSSSGKYTISRIVDDADDTETVGQRSLFISVPDNKPLTVEMIDEAIKEIKPCS